MGPGRESKRSKILDILQQLTPFFILIAVFYFIHDEILVTGFMIIMITASFAIRYYKGEWKVMLFGIVMGLLFEIGSDMVYQQQYWENASLFGIPYWLPLMWGYGFVFIRRISNILVK